MNDLTNHHQDALYDRVTQIINAARAHVSRTVNTAMVHAYWLIGREIVEVEQAGEERAGYGEEVVNQLAARLSSRFGRGFATSNVKRMRQFYLAFLEGSRTPEEFGGPEKGAAARRLSGTGKKSPATRHQLVILDEPLFPTLLSWTRDWMLVTVRKLTHQDLGQIQRRGDLVYTGQR